MLVAIKWPKLGKALELENISNSIFQACSNKFFEVLIALFQTYIDYVYHSFIFRTAHTLVLKKVSRNKSFIISKSYCLIALLNILSKTLESIMTKKIIYLAEKYKILSNTQIKKSGRFTE